MEGSSSDNEHEISNIRILMDHLLASGPEPDSDFDLDENLEALKEPEVELFTTFETEKSIEDVALFFYRRSLKRKIFRKWTQFCENQLVLHSKVGDTLNSLGRKKVPEIFTTSRLLQKHSEDGNGNIE